MTDDAARAALVAILATAETEARDANPVVCPRWAEFATWVRDMARAALEPEE